MLKADDERHHPLLLSSPQYMGTIVSTMHSPIVDNSSAVLALKMHWQPIDAIVPPDPQFLDPDQASHHCKGVFTNTFALFRSSML